LRIFEFTQTFATGQSKSGMSGRILGPRTLAPRAGALGAPASIQEDGMMMTDVIRESVSEHEIYFLLTAYVQAVRHADKLECLPSPLRGLPLNGTDDLRERVEALQTLRGSPRAPGALEPVLLGEALDIFATAHGRLGSIERARREHRLPA
jgi:hypothetical protein